MVVARKKIVEGAVGTVELALEKLNERGIVRLSDEAKGELVSRLLVVLCSDKVTSPVLDIAG